MWKLVWQRNQGWPCPTQSWVTVQCQLKLMVNGLLWWLLEKEMATHSSLLAWRIPWTGESGGLRSVGLQRVGTWLSTQHWWLGGKKSVCQCRRLKFNPWVRKISCWRKWQATPVLLPGKSHGQQSLVGYSRGRNTVGHDLVTKQQKQQLVHKWSC